MKVVGALTTGDAQHLLGRGEMEERLRRMDWTKSMLGAPDAWPPSLNAAVRVMLANPRPLMVWWGDRLIVLYNDAAISAVGSRHAAALGQPAAYVWRDSWDWLGPQIESVLRLPASSPDRVVYLHAGNNGDDESGKQAFTLSLLPNDDGGPGGVLLTAVAMEIGAAHAARPTESHAQQRLEQQLRNSEQRYRQLVQSLPAAVYTCDVEGRIELYSDAAVELWGAAPALADARWCGSLRMLRPSGEPWAVAEYPLALAVREGRPLHDVAIIIERPDGSRRNVLANPEPQFDAEGQVIGGVNMLRDVTDRHLAEMAQAQLAAIVESSDDAIVSRTLDGVIVSWNQGAQRVFGYATEDIIGQNISVLVPPEHIDEERDILARLRRGWRIDHVETQRVAKHGRRIDVSLSVSPVRDKTGNIIGASMIARDVTVRKRAEEELADARNDLALQVRALTRLHDLTMLLATRPDLEAALEAILKTLVEIHGADFGLVSLYDADSGLMRHGAAHGLDDGVIAALSRAFEEPLAGAFATAFSTKRRAVIEDIDAIDRYPELSEAARLVGFRAIHATPILTPTKVILGVLSLYFRAPRSPSRRERQLANLCARHAADVIDARRSEHALRESEERFSRFMRHLPGLAWIKDDAGRYVFANDAAERGFGRSREELYGRVDEEIFSPATAAQFSENDQQALSAETGIETIETLQQADGVHHSLVSKFPIPGAGGAPTMIGGIAIDVTERLQAEKALRDSEARFRSVLTNAPAAIFIKDLEGRYTLVNPLASEALGRPTGAEGFTDHELLLPEVADRIREVDLQVIASGKSSEQEEVVERPGYYSEFLSVKFPMRDSEGRITGVCGVAVDVTERKRAQRALRDSDQRLRLATQTGKLGVWDWDIANDRISWSESLYAIHGVNPEWFRETTGDFTALVHPDDRELVARSIRDALDAEAPYELEFRAVRPDGETIWLFTNAVVLREEGVPVRMLGATMDITERKGSELALRESEERFRALASHAPVGIFRAEPNGDTVFVNDNWCAMAGMTPEEARGTGWMKALHPDDRERVISDWEEAVRTGGPTSIEFRFQRPDGVVTWLQGNAAPLRGAADELLGYIGSVADITHRMRAEEALRNSERMYRAIGESIDYGIWVCDAEGRNIYCSESFLNLVGMSQEEASDLGWTHVLHPDDVEQTVAAWQQCVRAGLPWDVEHRFRGADGRWRPVLARGVPVRDDSGEITAWVGINLDISHLKQVEIELRESEARFRSMADNAPVLIWVNGIGGCQFVNREYLRFAGCTPEDVSGMNWTAFVHPADREGYLEAYQEAFARRGPFEAQVRMRRADGEFRWLSSTGAPRMRGDGAFLGYVGCSVDVTDIKASEEALREADRRKDDFLAMLGHELRNPLAGIVTGAQVLSMLDLDGEAREMQEVIARQASHMSQIVDDLLDVSRIARGKLTLRHQHVNLCRLVRDAVEDYRRSRSLDSSELRFSMPWEELWVWADHTRITQALTNILHNSFKFSGGANDIAVELSADRQARLTKICVTDSGIGMTQETLDRIFVPFNQADTSLERSRGGLGLGLALTKGLTALHGGSVSAESAGLGQGSRFTITLPLSDRPADAAPAVERAAEGRRRVLIIDDRRDAILPLDRLLRMEGHEVATAMDGPSGLAKAAAFLPEVVLCDIGLAGDMNGYDVIRAMRRMPEVASSYIVAVTGYGQEDDRRHAREAGFDYHVTKPLDRRQVAELMNRMPRF